MKRKFAFMALFFVNGCVMHPKTLGELTGHYSKDHWISLPAPDGIIKIGSIVSLKQSGNGSYIISSLGNLGDCGVPISQFVASGPDQTFDASDSETLSGSIKINIANFLPGFDESDTQSVTLTGVKGHVDNIDIAAINSWLSNKDNATVVGHNCQLILKESDSFIVEQAFVVSAGSIEIKSTRSHGVTLTPPAGGALATIGASVGNDGTSKLTFTAPVTVSIRKVAFLGDGTLGHGLGSYARGGTMGLNPYPLAGRVVRLKRP
jgi:hypothetical protein